MGRERGYRHSDLPPCPTSIVEERSHFVVGPLLPLCLNSSWLSPFVSGRTFSKLGTKDGTDVGLERRHDRVISLIFQGVRRIWFYPTQKVENIGSLRIHFLYLLPKGFVTELFNFLWKEHITFFRVDWSLKIGTPSWSRPCPLQPWIRCITSFISVLTHHHLQNRNRGV